MYVYMHMCMCMYVPVAKGTSGTGKSMSSGIVSITKTSLMPLFSSLSVKASLASASLVEAVTNHFAFESCICMCVFAACVCVCKRYAHLTLLALTFKNTMHVVTHTHTHTHLVKQLARRVVVIRRRHCPPECCDGVEHTCVVYTVWCIDE
jgi:hypothetical protein